MLRWSIAKYDGFSLVAYRCTKLVSKPGCGDRVQNCEMHQGQDNITCKC